jgi:hypothetical protein
MGCLREPSHEKFALEYVERIFSGMPRTKALSESYKAAGYVPRAANARRLIQRDEVRRRVEELTAEASEFANVRAKRIVVEVDRIARANYGDLFEPAVDAEGKPILDKLGKPTSRLKDITELPRELTAAIAGFDERGLPKMYDKNQANFTLLKHLGGLPEDQRAPQVNILNVLSIEDQQILADYLESLGRGAAGAAGPAALEHRETATVP